MTEKWIAMRDVKKILLQKILANIESAHKVRAGFWMLFFYILDKLDI